MIELAAVLLEIAEVLRRSGVGFAVVGGLAVGVRSEPRFTRDADLAVGLADDGAAQRLVRQLLGCGYRQLAVLEQVDTGRLATVRLVSPQSHGANRFVVDLLFATTGIEDRIVAAAEPAEVLPGVVLPVARCGHLVAMKVLSASDRRLQDRADLQALIRRCDPAELDVARQALDAIAKAGCARGRDLRGDLEEHLRLARLPPDPAFRPRALPPGPPPS